MKPFALTAVAAVALIVLAACGGGGLSESEVREILKEESPPAPTPTARVVYVYVTPEPTPSPVPTSTPEPTPTPAAKSTPVATPTPAATPAPEVNDYYVVIYQGDLKNDNKGVLLFHASYPFEKNVRGGFIFKEEAFFLDYLVKERAITPEQKNAYFNDERIKIPLLLISNASYKLNQTDEHIAIRIGLNTRLLLHYADKSSLDSNQKASDIESLLVSGDEGYVTIGDGKISVSAVDDDGNTTTVNVEGVGAKELLDYWLSQNKITIQQVNQYGQTGELQFSLKDGVDLFDFASSSDGGSSFSLDKESRDIIANEILPLFKFGD